MASLAGDCGGGADELGGVGFAVGADPGGGEVGDEGGLAVEERSEAFDVARYGPAGGVVGAGVDPGDSSDRFLWIEHVFDTTHPL